MYRIGFCLLVVIFWSVANAQDRAFEFESEINTKHPAQPLLVQFEFSPWRNPYSSDMPSFVLYDDGTVIFDHDKEPLAFRPFTVKLEPDEVAGLLLTIGADKFDSYSERYTMSDSIIATDLPSPFIMIRRKDGSYKSVHTYGLLGESAEPKFRVLNLPAPLLKAFEYLARYDNPKASSWMPEYIEFIFWEYDGKSKKNVDWPIVNEEQKVPFTMWGTQHYSIFVPMTNEKTYATAYFKAQRKVAPLLMDGKRWNSTYRFPYPWERVWMERDGKIFRDGRD